MTTDIEVSAQENASVPTRRMTIVLADMVGSMRLSYEAGDLALRIGIGQLLARVSHLLAIHSGQLIKDIGDGFLAVFEDSVAAIEFAAQLLQTLERNSLLVGNEKIILRMGMHTGMIQLRQTSYGLDIFGEAVNVAARLETCAPVGQLIVSEAVFDTLPDNLQASFQPIGELFIKGVSTAIQAYVLTKTGE